ncbi:MAG TPA: hypothetical protein DFR83_00860, partial [Deltaproteobacteria bacterium]|nr:hypothetical protein [Deltaproteobacteria bacterium]
MALVDRVVAVSPDVKSRLVAADWSVSTVMVVHNGIDCRPFEPPDAATCLRIRRELAAPDPDHILVGTVGRLTAQNAQHHIFAMAARLRDSHPRIRFALVGTGARAEELRTLGETLGVSDRVLLAGQRVDIPQILSSVDRYLSCSDWPTCCRDAHRGGGTTVHTRYRHGRPRRLRRCFDRFARHSGRPQRTPRSDGVRRTCPGTSTSTLQPHPNGGPAHGGDPKRGPPRSRAQPELSAHRAPMGAQSSANASRSVQVVPMRAGGLSPLDLHRKRVLSANRRPDSQPLGVAGDALAIDLEDHIFGAKTAGSKRTFAGYAQEPDPPVSTGLGLRPLHPRELVCRTRVRRVLLNEALLHTPLLRAKLGNAPSFGNASGCGAGGRLRLECRLAVALDCRINLRRRFSIECRLRLRLR